MIIDGKEISDTKIRDFQKRWQASIRKVPKLSYAGFVIFILLLLCYPFSTLPSDTKKDFLLTVFILAIINFTLFRIVYRSLANNPLCPVCGSPINYPTGIYRLSNSILFTPLLPSSCNNCRTDLQSLMAKDLSHLKY